MKERRQGPEGARRWLLPTVVAILATTWFLPGRLYPLAWNVGYAVCHQLPGHSYFAGAWQLPLCARCTGHYLGAFSALLYLVWRGRQRAARWPDKRVLLLLGLGVAAWAVDGANSFADFLGAPHLYAPQQPLRLATGLAAGMAWITAFWPLWVRAMVPAPEERAVWDLQDIPVLAGLATVVGAAVHFGSPSLRLVLGVLSGMSAWFFLTLVMAAGIRFLFGPRFPDWATVGTGLLGAVILVTAVGLVRAGLGLLVGA